MKIAIVTTKVPFLYGGAEFLADSLCSKLSEYGYDWFIINMDLSKEKLVELYTRKNYNDSLPRLDQMIAEHNKFLQEYGEDINISIKDNDFRDRLKLSYSAVSDFIGQRISTG